MLLHPLMPRAAGEGMATRRIFGRRSEGAIKTFSLAKHAMTISGATYRMLVVLSSSIIAVHTCRSNSCYRCSSQSITANRSMTRCRTPLQEASPLGQGFA